VKIHIPEAVMSKCKTEVIQFTQSDKKFREIGGYLIGTYDRDFDVAQFILDVNSQSSTTRIKLSFDCYERVEQIIEQNPQLSYIGTWHVHPGRSKPHYSLTDKTTLFLEKLILETDNPCEYLHPRIHLIFSEDLIQVAAYTMQVELEVQIAEYWAITKNIEAEDITKLSDLIEDLQQIQVKFQDTVMKPQLNSMEEIIGRLGQARETFDALIERVEDIYTFMDIKTLIKREQKNLEKKIKSLIKKGDTIGIIFLTEEGGIELSDYRPAIIQEHFEMGVLIGFWRYYTIANPPLEFQKIFLANYYKKIDESPNPFVYIMVSPAGFQYFDVEPLNFQGITFSEIKVVREEFE